MIYWPCIIVSVGLLAGCSIDPKATDTLPPSSVAVEVVPVIMSESPLPIKMSGTVAARNSFKLSFKQGGIVRQIAVEEGEVVEAEQLLAHLDRAEINAAVKQAQSAYDMANRDMVRTKNLYIGRAATLEEMQNVKTSLDMAEANLEIAQFNLKHSAIRAPSAGKILRKFVEENELVAPGAPIFLMESDEQQDKIIEVYLTDQDIVHLQVGDSAHVQLDTYPDQVFQARLTELAQVSDPLTGTFAAKLLLESHSELLRNGFIGTVAIFPAQQPPYYRIPFGAVVETAGSKAFIYVPNHRDSTAQAVTIRPHHLGADFVAVLSTEVPALREVITQGAPYLRPGTKIKYTYAYPAP